MKAKELAEILKAAKTDEEKQVAIEKVFLQCNSDLLDLVKVRKPVSSGAYISIFKEVDGKWQAMCRLAPGYCNPLGFRTVLTAKFPEVAYAAFGEAYG